MIDKVLYAIIGAVAGFLVFFILKPIPDAIAYPEIIVHEIKGEPDTVRTFVDRIVYRERAPELVATQPGGGEDVVEDFCHPDTVQVVAGTDTLWLPADTVYLLRSVTTDPGWFFQRDRITLYGPTSVGDLREMRFVGWPGWSVRTDPDVLFREPRFGLFHKVIEAATYIGIGYLGGKVF